LVISCSPQRRQFEKTNKEIAEINNRKSLKQQQEQRKRHIVQYKESGNEELEQSERSNEAAIQAAIEKGRKRHLMFQTEETRKRMQKSAKESEKNRK
jgi:hypothetical protein